MKSVPQLPFDPALMQRRFDGFRATGEKQMTLLPQRTLYEMRPRNGLYTVAAAAAALGCHDEARRILGCIARLANASLTVGASSGPVTIVCDWPERGYTVVGHGPADPVDAPDWVFAFSAAMTADDGEAERELLGRRTLRAARGVHFDAYWAELVETWARICAGDIGGAGAPLVRALELADPNDTVMSADYVLCVVVPVIELMLAALDRDQDAFDAAIVKGLERLQDLCAEEPNHERLHLPVHLLAAVRLGLRRGLRMQVTSPALQVLTAAGSG